MTRSFGPDLGIGAAALAIALFVGSGTVTDAMGEHVTSSESVRPMHGARLVIPMMSPVRGKNLFVDKGCVACHAINGVGGHDGAVRLMRASRKRADAKTFRLPVDATRPRRRSGFA